MSLPDLAPSGDDGWPSECRATGQAGADCERSSARSRLRERLYGLVVGTVSRGVGTSGVAAAACVGDISRVTRVIAGGR